MPKPICVKCQRFYRPQRNAVPVIEGMPTHNLALPGTREPQSWRPYKIWSADQWHCEGCGHEIVVGFGLNPRAIQHEQGFKLVLDKLVEPIVVNDC
jgi:hypothetical protein